MRLEELSKEKRLDIFNNHLIKDFHKSEVKPLELIENLIEKNTYVCYGFYEDEELLGYVYFVKSGVEGSLFIDYFAVCRGHRSKGLGSRFIKIIVDKFSKEYLSLIAEVENPEFSFDELDKINRERRIKFYLENEFKLTNLKSRVLTDDYIMIQLPFKKELKNQEIQEKLKDIYETVFGLEFCKNNVEIFL